MLLTASALYRPGCVPGTGESTANYARLAVPRRASRSLGRREYCPARKDLQTSHRLADTATRRVRASVPMLGFGGKSATSSLAPIFLTQVVEHDMSDGGMIPPVLTLFSIDLQPRKGEFDDLP